MSNAEQVVKNIVDLPTLPQIITTLMAMLDDPDSSVRDINNVMGKDQTMVAKILKLVNSAFYGIPKRVNSVPQAIAILGFKTVKSIVLSASIIGLFESSDGDFSYQEFWVNSLGVGTISRFISGKLAGCAYSGCAEIHPDTAFVTGLLSGIGKVVLEQYCHDDFERIVARAKEEKLSFHEAETGLAEADSNSLGHWLAKRWNLSSEVQGAILYQDDLENCPVEHRAMAAVVALAKYLCRLKRYGHGGDYDDPPKPPRQAIVTLALSRDTLPDLAAGLAAEFEKAESFLSVIRT